MLSKYYYWENNSVNQQGVFSYVNDVRNDICKMLQKALTDELKKRYYNVQVAPLRGGTLGILYEGWLDGRRKCIKSHLQGDMYKANLLKEIKLLTYLYGDSIQIEQISVKTEHMEYFFMVTDWVSGISKSLEPYQLKNQIIDYQNKLSGCRADINYCFEDVVKAGKEALHSLAAARLLSPSLQKTCQEAIEYITQHLAEKERVVCHGDLSNANIIVDEKERSVILDWEDAIWAFEEYDFLYWLTFLSQRKYYSIELFEKNSIAPQWGRDVMMLIILVKCNIAYKNGTYCNQRFSFEERLREVVDLV